MHSHFGKITKVYDCAWLGLFFINFWNITFFRPLLRRQIVVPPKNPKLAIEDGTLTRASNTFQRTREMVRAKQLWCYQYWKRIQAKIEGRCYRGAKLCACPTSAARPKKGRKGRDCLADGPWQAWLRQIFEFPSYPKLKVSDIDPLDRY